VGISLASCAPSPPPPPALVSAEAAETTYTSHGATSPLPRSIAKIDTNRGSIGRLGMDEFTPNLSGGDWPPSTLDESKLKIERG
jgi:hypothetical protein